MLRPRQKTYYVFQLPGECFPAKQEKKIVNQILAIKKEVPLEWRRVISELMFRKAMVSSLI